jgi:hypothetical protein
MTTETHPTIKAEELRIGNWVLMQNQLEDYWPMPIEDGCEISGAEKYKPIPLTPEILEKCGFELNKYNSTYGHSGIGYLCLEPLNQGQYDVIPICDNGKAINKKPLQHLHQLQNLYYTLTGEELNLNL